MHGTAIIFRLITGLIVLGVFSFPLLAEMRLTSEAEECSRRRMAIEQQRIVPTSHRVCPRDNMPYIFELNAEDAVAVRCPNGHDREPFPLHEWVNVRK